MFAATVIVVAKSTFQILCTTNVKLVKFSAKQNVSVKKIHGISLRGVVVVVELWFM